MRIKEALIKCAKVGVVTSLFLLKLPVQLAGGIKRPDIFIDSTEGYRFPVYLSISLVSEFLLEIRIEDLLFFYRYLPFRDFIFKTVVLLPGKNPVAPLVLSGQSPYPSPSKRTIMIDGDYYSSPKGDGSHLVMPYFAHPEFYRNGLHLRAPVFRHDPRPFRIFFCGTVHKESYSRGFHFPLLNRNEIIEYISRHFADHIAHSMKGPGKAITLLITDDSRDMIEKHPFSPARFLQALGEADFFIAPPGWRMPHSHNIIEAMAAGAVPITNYGHLFHPPLQNGIDCLSFASYEDLDQVLRQAIAMPAEQVASLRKGAMDYYQRHLKPSSFGASFRRFCSSSIDPMHLVVNEERNDYGVSTATSAMA